MIGPLLMDSIVSAITATVCACVVMVGVAFGFLQGLKRHRRARRARRHQARILDLEALRQVRRGGLGLGVTVWARAEDVEPSRLAAHLSACATKSGRLLAAAEGAAYDPTFVESLHRLHAHLEGLANEYQPAERRPAAKVGRIGR